MKNIWAIVEACKAQGHMVRIALFPGGHMNVGIYDSEKQMKQHMYDHFEVDKLEAAMMKDWGHLINSNNLDQSIKEIITKFELPKPSGMPLPPGFPKL
jgi:hypothetical protein